VNALTFNLSQARAALSDTVELYDALLNELNDESENLEGWAKQKFQQRFAVLEKLLDVIIAYDQTVQKYVQFHPDSHNVQYYKEKLDSARRYIIANGLDWQTVTWGKISDYQR